MYSISYLAFYYLNTPHQDKKANMNGLNNTNIAFNTETGITGIYHLKRLWSKAISGPNVVAQYPEENLLDSTLIDMLGTGLLPTYRFLFEHKPDFESFEKWIIENANGAITPELTANCNAFIENKSIQQAPDTEDVLTAADIAFWNEQGYVIVRNAVAPEDCEQSRKGIMDFLQMDEQDASSWYRITDDIQGIMVNLFNHPALNKNRQSSRIRRAFEQIWNRTDLIVSADKCGFNPPETDTCKYMGTGLHWDVSLATPIPFGTQGIIYLTDTAASQGAFTLVPGFHKKLDNWLSSIPESCNPRETDFSSFGPVPIAANAGDCIIWNHKLPHGASPNRSSLPRIVQYINWYAPLETVQGIWK
jgi:hypothetical protein